MEPGTSIVEYLHERSSAQGGIPRGRPALLLRKVTTQRMRDWAKLRGTTLLIPLTRVRAHALLRTGRQIRLNLGSGPRRVPGWINLDLLGMGAHLCWDLRRRLPFPDESTHSVFLEHVIEHFSIEAALTILTECRRVLVPGGVIRVGVPDFGRYMTSYASDGRFIDEVRPGRPTQLLAVAEVALLYGHRSVWDSATLERALSESGYANAGARAWGDSALMPPPDTPARRPETLYVEATKLA